LLEYVRSPLPPCTHEATVTLIKVKPWNVLLLVLLVCVHEDLKSVLSRKILISVVYQPKPIFMWARMPGSVVYYSKPKVVRD
jgi:hypothetical protein